MPGSRKARTVPSRETTTARDGNLAMAAAEDDHEGLQTEHLYYRDTYNFSCEAKVLLIKDVDLEKRTKLVVTDRTVLHPQGGLHALSVAVWVCSNSSVHV